MTQPDQTQAFAAVPPTNDATNYAVALNQVDPAITAEQTAWDVAYVFLEPMALFRLWVSVVRRKYF